MIVCLQAEDGIRDANEGREFRRVLVRSGFFGTDRTGGYSDLDLGGALAIHNDKDVFNRNLALEAGVEGPLAELPAGALSVAFGAGVRRHDRSEEHTPELQSLMRISYAVFCLKKKNM